MKLPVASREQSPWTFQPGDKWRWREGKLVGQKEAHLPLREDKTPTPGCLLGTLIKGLSHSLKVKLLLNITIYWQMQETLQKPSLGRRRQHLLSFLLPPFL